MSDPFLPIQGDPGEERPPAGLDVDAGPTEVEIEQERAERPDPSGDGHADRSDPPATPTDYQAPDGESVDPAAV